MNLYNLHSRPKSLLHGETASDFIHDVFVEDGELPSGMTKAQVRAVSKVPELAYQYAANVP